MSKPEPTPTPTPEVHDVIFVVSQDGGGVRVYRGKAYVLPETIYVDTIDADGLAWLRAWQESGFFAAHEVEIKSKGSRDQRRRVLFEGFVSLGYLNPRETPDREQKSIERFVAFLRVNQPFKGTPIVLNWREFKGNSEAWYCEEWVIYSDAYFSGSFALGPYKILNTAIAREDFVNGALVLRAYIHPSFWAYKPYTPKTLDKSHKSFRDYRERLVISFCDEMAALLSVATDRRLIAGESIRRFGITEDSMGDPCYP